MRGGELQSNEGEGKSQHIAYIITLMQTPSDICMYAIAEEREEPGNAMIIHADRVELKPANTR